MKRLIWVALVLFAVAATGAAQGKGGASGNGGQVSTPAKSGGEADVKSLGPKSTVVRHLVLNDEDIKAIDQAGQLVQELVLAHSSLWEAAADHWRLLLYDVLLLQDINPQRYTFSLTDHRAVSKVHVSAGLGLPAEPVEILTW